VKERRDEQQKKTPLYSKKFVAANVRLKRTINDDAADPKGGDMIPAKRRDDASMLVS
jgi:hypothetical protein